MIGRRRIGFVALALLSLAGCAQETRITRVDSGVVTDLSGRWNDTDSRIVAESMVKEALEYPWLNNFSVRKDASLSSSLGPFRTAVMNISTSTRL